MTRRSPACMQPVVDAAPRVNVVQSDTEARTLGGFTALWESAAQQILAVTYWFDPVLHPGPYPVTVRFSGRRVDVKGRLSPGDRFVQDETIEEVVPGSGPISLTTRVRDINPGEWAVTAHMLGSVHPAHRTGKYGNAALVASPLHPAARFWRRWAPSAESAEQVRTCPTPFARVPGIFPGMWGTMVTLGMAVALALQFLVISADHLRVGSWWAVTFAAIVVGIAGAKLWFIVLHRHEHRIEGWCIQGFITGAILAAAILLAVLDMPAGVFLDVTAPGLLVAIAVGKVGCFFGGCCGGPPTASRWGVWSSDQRVGARRIPTQLLESVLALSLGLLVLVAVVGHGPAGGLHPGATRSAASARRAAQDEAGWAGNFRPGSARARRSRRLARSVAVEYVVACCIWRRRSHGASTAMTALTVPSGSGNNVGMDFTNAYAEHFIGKGSL